ncbi:MAG: putative Ig domain-containing protein [Kiritimatiellae bacterium]|nr:putative Ig domain-containing protein [Kiritimatiellia bacterium]
MKNNLRETPFMAGMQHVDEYVRSGKYSFFPPYPQTVFLQPEYYRTVLVVGWDDEVPANYFRAEDQCPEGPGAWIVKSSRGEGAGDGGYFYVSFYDRSLLKTNEGMTFHLKDDLVLTVLDGMLDDGLRSYGAVYSYDLDSPSEFGMTYRDSYGIMFTADRDALIGGIGIFDLTGRSYKIYARTGCQAGKPASGTLVLSGESVSNRLRAKGYNVYPLSNPFEVKKGQRFSIMVEGSGLAFMRKDKFVKGRYFHGSKVAGSEWNDIAVTAEEEEYQDYSVPFITAYEKAEGVFLQASDGDFVELDGTIRTEYGVEVKWETTVKAGTPVYDLYRAPEGTDAFKLVKSGLRELRYVDLLSTCGGELEIDRKYDYKVVDTVHDIESNVNSGFAGTLPRLLDVEPAKLWLTGEGPYNARLTWNAYNSVYTVSAKWHLLKKRGGSTNVVSYTGTSSNVGTPGDKKEVDVSEAISLITPKGGHGAYDMNVQWTAHNTKSGNSKTVDTNGKRCDVNVYFNKYKREAGKSDISNWFLYWPEDGAIDPQYFKQEVYVENEVSQIDGKFYFCAGNTVNRGNTSTYFIERESVNEKVIELLGSSLGWSILPENEEGPKVYKCNKPLSRYYLSDLGAAIGDRISSAKFSGYSDPAVGEASVGLQKVADTIEHERRHGFLFEKLYKDKYFLYNEKWDSKTANLWRSKMLCDWSAWARSTSFDKYSFLEDYAGQWVVDIDGDGVSDSYENQVSQEIGVLLSPANPDTRGVKAYNEVYATCGDNEYLARHAESEANTKVWTNPNNDWAFPGSQIAQCYQGHQKTISVIKSDPITQSSRPYYPYWGFEEKRVKDALQRAYPSDPCQCCCGYDNCVCSVGENLCDESDVGNASVSAKKLTASKESLTASVDELVTRDSGVLKEYYPGMPSQFIDGGLGIVSVGEGVGIDSGDWYYSSLAFPVAITNVSDEAQSCIMRGYLVDSDEHAVAWATVDITVPANSTVEENLVFDGKDIFVAYDTTGYSLASVVLEPYESNYCAVYDMTNAMASTIKEYNSYDFSPPDAYMYLDYVNESITWQGLDISLEIANETANDMRVVGILSDTNGQFVAQTYAWARKNDYSDVKLLFSREQINYSGYYGPFVLSLVQVLDGSDVVCGARNAYTTQVYTTEDFQYESAQPLTFSQQSFRRRYLGNTDVADFEFAVENASSDLLEFTAIAVVRGADGSYACSVFTNAALVSGRNKLSVSVAEKDLDGSVAGPYSVSEIIFSPSDSLLYDRVRFFPKRIGFGFDGTPDNPPVGAGAGFVVSAEEVDEGETAEIRVNGGNEEKARLVKVYLTYNTAVAADVDLGKLKFPLTLTWEAGEVGEKVITIPVKKDTVVEMDEFFTLQLADAQGMELGENRVCTVTIHDPGYDELAVKIKAGAATKAEQATWDKLQKAKAPYVCVLADPADAGKTTGSGLYTAGKKVALKATANKGYVFAGWGMGNGVILNGQDARSPSMSFVMPGEDVALMAMFATMAEDAESLKVTVEDMMTESDGSIGTLGSDGTRSFDLGACVTSLSLPKLAVSGLPSGFKFDAKTNRITGKATKPGIYAVTVKATNASVTKATDATTATFRLTVPNFSCDALPGLLAATEAYGTVSVGVAFGADRIDCAPEKDWSVKVAGLPAGLKYDAKTDMITGIPTAKPGAYTVTFTASKKGEKNQIATITLNVEALPDWSVGSFTGYVKPGDYGLVTMTVAASGKISGKIQHGGTNWTFKADSFSRIEHVERVDESSISIETNFVINAVATAGKAKREMELHVTDGSGGRGATALPGMINAKVEGATEDGMQTFSLWRTIWKDKATADAAKRTLAEWDGTYNVSLGSDENSGYGSGYLSLVVGKDGNVKATGKLADGTSISATSPLMYDAEHGYFILVYAAPSAYMGGSFALSISFDGPKGALGNSVEVSKWSSRNPQATGVYGEGFARWVSFFGSYYDKNASLTNFYDRLTLELAELPPLVASCKRTYFNEEDRKVTETQPIDAAPVYLLDEDGLTVSVNAKETGFDVLKATKPVQDKGTKRWNYPGPNDGGLTLTFDPKTGIFKGTYTFWYDYISVSDETMGKETWTHASQKVSFEGLMVQGESPRGFYLREESSSYEDPKTGKPKTYKYKSSHGIHFTSSDSGWRKLKHTGNEWYEGEWYNFVSVKRGTPHTFWVDRLSPETSVAEIDVEGSYTYLKDGEEHEVLVGASQRGEISDRDGNLAGFFVTLTTNDWFVDEYTPKSVRFKVTVGGDYDGDNVINNRFKFHHARGLMIVR